MHVDRQEVEIADNASAMSGAAMTVQFPMPFEHRRRIIPKQFFACLDVSNGNHFKFCSKTSVGIAGVVAEEERRLTHDVFFGADLEGVTFFVTHVNGVKKV